MLTDEINIDPDVWGPDFWHTIEAISCTLIPSNKQDILQFFYAIAPVIPCEKCRGHYRKYLENNPIQGYMQNSLTLLLWIYKLRCEIKKRQEKEIVPFIEWIRHLVDKYDVPELLYYLEKNEEYRKIMESLNVTSSPFFDRYKLFEYQ